MWSYFKAKSNIQAKSNIFFLCVTCIIELLIGGRAGRCLLSEITLWKMSSFGNF